MSEPEWMQKFNQIGQKQDDEEVVTFDLKTGASSRALGLSSGDDDAAALFGAAGSHADGDDDDEAAGLFAAAGDDEEIIEEEIIEDGDRWVVDKEEVIDEEEIIVDEDGNEIVEEIIEEEEAPTGPVYDPYDVENQRKLLQRGSKAYRSRMAFWVPYFLTLGLVAGVLLVLFYVILSDDITRVAPTQAPSPEGFLPLEPTNSGTIDVSATTELDPVTGQCDFSELEQPNVVDQCSCTGRLSIIADDVRARYEKLKKTFIPTILPDFDEDIDSCDASNQALVWLSSGINNAGESPDFVKSDRYALAYFYIQQGGVGWDDNSLWLSQVDACLWFGVSCNDDSMVTEVDVARNGLIGQLSEAVGLLENLETLKVSGNNIAGTIPPELLGVESLRVLDFSNNAFFGVIPPFPDSSSLERIEFQSNNLSGELTSSIGNLQSLTSLNLANNALVGPFPPSVFDSPSLTGLYISKNFFDGSIPEEIGNAAGLVELALGPNDFTGIIPTSLGDLNNLTRLIIEGVPTLEGRLPASYGFGLTNLVEFVLTGTGVRGNIPDTFGSMTALEVLNFAKNSLGRQLPQTLGALTNLRKLHLQENAFTGTIPTQLGNAEALVELQLNDNQLVGNVPSTLGLLQDLTALTLENNFLFGRAPEEVCNLRGEELAEFTVDCPERVDPTFVVGVICSIPSCCTACF